MHRTLLLLAALALPVAAFTEEAVDATSDQEAAAPAAETETQPEEAAAPAQENVQEPTEAPAPESQPASQDE